jgi:flavin-binding protein dodecin
MGQSSQKQKTPTCPRRSFGEPVRSSKRRRGEQQTEETMADSVYKVIELVGTSKESWEKAAKAAVERAGKSLRELRIAEVVQLDMQIGKNGKVEAYRAKVKVSFKFEG